MSPVEGSSVLLLWYPSNHFTCLPLCVCACARADAFDLDLLVETVQKLKEGRHVEIPVYDFSTHGRAKYTVSGREGGRDKGFVEFQSCVCVCVCVYVDPAHHVRSQRGGV